MALTRCASLSRAIVLAVLFISGCARTVELRAAAERPLDDTSVVSSAMRTYRKIMVLPPSGTARAEFDPYISLFEKQFLRHEITVITAAVTGRVVLSPDEAPETRKSEGAAHLSDAERALVMAERTGAEAILQIGALEWRDGVDGRWFVLERGATAFRETDRRDYDAWNGLAYRLRADELRAAGRLIDVKDGQVVASFELRCNGMWSMPGPWRATFLAGKVLEQKSENYSFRGSTMDEAYARCRNRVVEQIVAHVTSTK